jgi:hypothetical protein
MARNFNGSTLVFVTIDGWDDLKYGFKSRIRESYQNDLGQTKITTANLAANLTGLVVGCNNPKPSIATKILTTGTESSYCSSDKIPTLRSKGWIIKPAKKSFFGKGSFSELKYVTINGLKYGWRGAKVETDVAALVKFVDYDVKAIGATDKAVFGCSFPKPPRVKIPFGVVDAEGNAGKSGNASSFIDPSKVDEARAAGYTVSGGKYTADDFKQYYGVV